MVDDVIIKEESEFIELKIPTPVNYMARNTFVNHDGNVVVQYRKKTEKSCKFVTLDIFGKKDGEQ